LPSRPYPFSCPKSFFGWMDSTGSTRSSQYVFTASPGALAGGQEGADMLMAHSARARRRVAHVARRLLSIHYGPDAARLQELLARSLVRGAPSCRTRARAGVPRLRAAGAPRRPRRSRGASRCSPRGERRCRCARRCPSARRVQQAPRRAEGGLRGAQRRYRDILRHSLLYTWDNERGQPWCAPGRRRRRGLARCARACARARARARARAAPRHGLARSARRPGAHADPRAGGT
jgi:hypothetical protein